MEALGQIVDCGESTIEITRFENVTGLSEHQTVLAAELGPVAPAQIPEDSPDLGILSGADLSLVKF